MEKCALCGGNLKKYSEMSDGVRLQGLKCSKCFETFWQGTEMLRWELLTGRRKNARRIGTLGDSLVVRLPKPIAKEAGARKGDFALFQKAKQGLLLRIVHAH